MAYFSIITICKNNINGLIKTHNSIINQKNRNYEWIVVDGQSDDGTEKWLCNTPEANWISERDNGIFDAMNKGMEFTTGDYLIFLNSGDEFANNHVLQDSFLYLNTNHPCFAYGDSIDIDEKGTEHYRKAKHHSKNRIGMITQHQAMFFYKPFTKSMRYSYDYPLTGDYAFISQILNKADKNKILYISKPICKFKMGGLNESKRFKALLEDYKIRKEIMKVPFTSNLTLYCLHFIHTIIKKISPSTRYIRHNSLKHIEN